MAYLALIEDNQEVALCDISPEITVIGSGYHASFHVPGAGVEERHAVITLNDSNYFITDQGSRSGTFVNTARIEQAQLQSGDTIRIGDHQLVFIARTERQGVPHPTLGMYDHEKTAGWVRNSGDQAEYAFRFKKTDPSRDVPFNGQDCIIGSDDTCDIVLKGWGIASTHAVILQENFGLTVVNVSDRRKIRINGRVMGLRQSVTGGDTIRIGSYTMKILVTG